MIRWDQLALSALPPHLRDNATVYVLNPDKGSEVARYSNADVIVTRNTTGFKHSTILVDLEVQSDRLAGKLEQEVKIHSAA
jgi:hypothetical protein